MKLIPMIFLFVITACSSVQTRSISSVTPMILVIGDSNLVGSFGETLHQEMASWREADVMSIAIGGGNATYYNRTMKNICCGYKVRASSMGEGKVKVIASSNSKNSAVILPEFNGSLSALIEKKKPVMIVIALGSNADSNVNHNSLVTKINKYNPDLPIYWIGPPDDSKINATRADGKIQAALNQYPRSPYSFFSSQKVAKKLHPGPAESQKWVRGFISELKGIAR